MADKKEVRPIRTIDDLCDAIRELGLRWYIRGIQAQSIRCADSPTEEGSGYCPIVAVANSRGLLMNGHSVVSHNMRWSFYAAALGMGSTDDARDVVEAADGATHVSHPRIIKIREKLLRATGLEQYIVDRAKEE